MKLNYDFLVIGSGIAGISFAMKVAPYGKVAIVTKTQLDDTNTRYAQGGIAAVTYTPDKFEKHVEDTLKAGCNLNDRAVVEMVVKEAPAQIEQLLEWGIQFDTTESGKFDLAKEFSNWIVKDETQKFIGDFKLLNKPLFTPNAKK